ncbi:hypothetical protein SynBIOSE41_01565 [Synechococcus sp. BIOS-E4-1]|uniref:hypothetical protein n=1 Tax=Synechococcus sp. BIOS-E4-1 TaxID=1400864 RepID=UPI00164926E9|nr:hypothetical protein [Synechococcus sp. BIOS-E4-1]QNI54080.1 hypothetical protein SynBIOSE41_01565 [Synechococcus sp. BIOS-E4-1]
MPEIYGLRINQSAAALLALIQGADFHEQSIGSLPDRHLTSCNTIRPQKINYAHQDIVLNETPLNDIAFNDTAFNDTALNDIGASIHVLEKRVPRCGSDLGWILMQAQSLYGVG